MSRSQRTSRGLFISYRRTDTAGEAGRLADHLVAALGEDSVFFDVADIALGDDWRSRIDGALDACDTMLVVIGSRWIDLRSQTDPRFRRLDQPGDMVAWEIDRALSRGLRVVQLLVQGTAPLQPEQLPPNIAALAMRQAVAIRHETFAADVRELVAQLRRARRVRSVFAGDWRASDLSRWARALDSGPEGTCAALTIVNALELLLARAGAPRRLSARYLYEKAKRSEQRAVEFEGIYMLPALFVASFFGIPAEHVWPYQPGRPKLPRGTTWEALEAKLGFVCRGEFFRTDGLADVVRQLGAGRPVIAVCETLGDVLDKPGAGGEIAMPSADAQTQGSTTVLVTGFDPQAARFRCLLTWGENWGDHGFATMGLDVARRLLAPDQMWAAELARETVDALHEQTAHDRVTPHRRRSSLRRRSAPPSVA